MRINVSGELTTVLPSILCQWRGKRGEKTDWNLEILFEIIYTAMYDLLMLKYLVQLVNTFLFKFKSF